MMNKINPLFLLILFLSLQACTTNYSAEPITARVVDAETSQPVEGVVVVAHWQLEGGLEGGNNLGQMMVMEAVTDQTGQFRFSAWGPKAMPSDYPLYASNARLKNMDPEMLFFKSGYQYLSLQNDKPLSQLGGMKPYVRTSDWNGKMIKMEKVKGGLQEYANHLGSLNSSLRYATAFEYCKDTQEGKGCTGRGICEWKNIPLMISAIGNQAKIFDAANIHVSTIYDYLLSGEEFFVRKNCGSVKEFFREHVK